MCEFILNQLFPPFDRLGKRLADLQIHRYFTGPFDHFEETLIEDLDWDLAPTIAVLPETKTRVLELGCGSGRVSLALAERGYPVTAVDNSEMALSRLEGRVRHLASSDAGIETSYCDIMDEGLGSGRTFPIVLLANLSMNLFGPGVIDRLIRRVGLLLSPDGAFCFGILTEQAVQNLDSYDGSAAGSIFCQQYQDEDNRERLMWMAVLVDLENDVMRTNWFVDLDASERYVCRYHASALTQQLWTPSRLYPILERHGFFIELEERVSIVGGGAAGQNTVFVRARRHVQ